MQHLTEEQLVAHYYHDDESHDAGAHLRDCAACRAELETIGRVLSLVNDMPVPDRDASYGDQVWTRVRWKLGSRRRRAEWITGLAAAAALALAFFAGQWWRAARNPVVTPTAPQTAAVAEDRGTKVLLLVVGEHLDSTERVLLEVANADPTKPLEIAKESERAGDLVAANRIYRQAASQDRNERIASILEDVEPVLIEISHAGTTLSAASVGELQKRIEAKGLLFKVRVISAETTQPRTKDNDHASNRI